MKNKKDKKHKKSNINLWELVVRTGVVVALIVGIKELIWSEPDSPEINNTINSSDRATINVAETINQTLNLEDEAEPIAIFNDISLEYISQSDDRISSHLYPMNFDDLSEYKSKYSVTDNCFTSLLISNNSKHEYQITKFSFYASEIKKDYRPYFEGWLNYDEINGLTINLHNDGWGQANNVKVEISDKNNILLDYFNAEDLVWYVDSFSEDEYKEIALLKNDDLLKYPKVDENIECIFTVSCDEGIFELEGNFVVSITSEGLFYVGGGAPSIMAYGIFIDTSNDTCDFSKNISEIIKSHSNIDIPICFYPDMSCDLTFYIELEIFTGTDLKKIKTEKKHMHFRVSHAAECYDGSNINYALIEEPEITFISYPFIENGE